MTEEWTSRTGLESVDVSGGEIERVRGRSGHGQSLVVGSVMGLTRGGGHP